VGSGQSHIAATAAVAPRHVVPQSVATGAQFRMLLVVGRMCMYACVYVYV
jgi:hypothetical protein